VHRVSPDVGNVETKNWTIIFGQVHWGLSGAWLLPPHFRSLHLEDVEA
jgi:hypothetical protein